MVEARSEHESVIPVWRRRLELAQACILVEHAPSDGRVHISHLCLISRIIVERERVY